MLQIHQFPCLSDNYGLLVHAPASGLPDAAVVRATREALDGLGAADKAVFFCRSGMRSAAAWAMAEQLAGGEPDALREAAAAAGYDLGRVPLYTVSERDRRGRRRAPARACRTRRRVAPP